MEEVTGSTLDETTFPYMYETFSMIVKAGVVKVSMATSLEAIFISIGCVGLIGNLFVLCVLSRTFMKKQRTSIYLMNQSVIDGLGSLFLILTTSIDGNGRYYITAADQVFCKIWVAKVPLWIMMFSSTYNLVALTLERYLSVVHPIWHKLKFTKRTVNVTLALIWVLGTGTSLVSIPSSWINDDGSCSVYQWKDVVAGPIVGLIEIIMLFLGPLAIFIICYSRMARVLLVIRVTPVNLAIVKAGQSAQEMQDGPHRSTTTNPADATTGIGDGIGVMTVARNDDGTNRHQPEPTASHSASASTTTTTTLGQGTFEDRYAKTRKNIFNTLVIVAFVYCICWTMNIGYFALSILRTLSYSSPFYDFTIVMVYCNCCVNPLIYACRYQQFQQAVKSLFLKNSDHKKPNSNISSLRTA